MSGKHTGKVLALAIVAGLPSLAIADGPTPLVEPEVIKPKADSKLTVRGGYATSTEEYPFAFEYTGGGFATRADEIHEAGYGDGFYGYLAYSNDAMFGRVGGEISLSHYNLSGDEDVSASALNSIFDSAGLSRNNGAEQANTTSDTQISSLRVLTSGNRGNGTQLLTGLGALQFSSDVEVNQSRTDFQSDVNRKTDYTGLGLVAGARKAIPISNNATLQLEGFAGVYTGDRSVDISDHFDGDTSETYETKSVTDRQTVFSLDLSASVAVPANRIAQGGLFELGLGYTRLFNVTDTTNYNPNTKPAYSGGSDSDDIDALSLFFGLQIPL